jgi:phosphatidylglycerol---prolipoprotein diacylglyceryl transferase
MHPVFLHIGFLEIRWYGLMYALGLLLAMQGILRDLKLKKIQFKEDDIINIILGTFLFALLGARLYYVLFNLPYYLANLSEIPAVWHGGLAIHGGIIAAVISGYFFCKHYQIKPWPFADIAVPYVLLGQVLGRFGNFMNGDAHGLPTNLPWGIIFPAGTPAGNEFPGQPLHPTMLYELVLNLLFFIILYRLRLKNYKAGFIFCLYLIFYSVARFIVSFFRADDLLLFGFNMPHIISIFTILACSYIIWRYQLGKRT